MKKGIFTWAVSKIDADRAFDLIKQNGFLTVMLDWSDDFPQQISKTDAADKALRAGLEIENAHLSFMNINNIWVHGDEGVQEMYKLKTDIELAAEYGIKTLVLHPSFGTNPPAVTNIGLQRFGKLINFANGRGIKLAFENVECPDRLAPIFLEYSDGIGFCYDVGHRNCFSPSEDVLSLYGDKISALHLHNNNGFIDEHNYLFSGTVDWKKEMELLRKYRYTGNMTVEISWNGNTDYSDYLNMISSDLDILIKEFERSM